jgi:hypothetical protein
VQFEQLGKQSSHDVFSFSPDQFHVHFSSVATGVRVQDVFDRQEIFEAFSFRYVEEDEVRFFDQHFYISLCMEDGSGFVFAQVWLFYWLF